MNNPKIFEIEVVNWDKHQPKRKDVKHPTWFILKHDLFEDPGIFKLTAAEFKVWIYLLTQCSKSNRSSITVDTHLIRRLIGVRTQEILKCISKLEQFRMVRCSSRNEDEPLYNTRLNKIITTRSIGKKITTKTKGDPEGIAAFIGVFVKAYQKTYGDKTRPELGPKVQGQIRNFLRGRSLNEACALIQVYFQMKDQWFIKKCHDFTTFLENTQKIRLALETGKENGTGPPEINWDRVMSLANKDLGG